MDLGASMGTAAQDGVRCGAPVVPQFENLKGFLQVERDRVRDASRGTTMRATGSVEALLETIEGASEQAADLELWVPARLTLRGNEVATDVAMAIVLDRLLGKGFMPAGFAQEATGRKYRYKREISN
jgi:hypothetical protein